MSNQTTSSLLSLLIILCVCKIYSEASQKISSDDIDRDLIARIKILLNKRNLTHRYDYLEIYNETFILVDRVLSKGIIINNFFPYCIQTANNFTIKCQKKEIKMRVTATILEIEFNPFEDILLSEIEKIITILPEALKELKTQYPNDHWLIEQHDLKRRTWIDIAREEFGNRYTASEYDRLRQQGARARKKLKVILQEIIDRNRSLE